MTDAKVGVNHGDEDSGVVVQNEGEEARTGNVQRFVFSEILCRKRYLNTSTVANGSDDSGRKRLMVNFVG